jgi:hypothetical protein
MFQRKRHVLADSKGCMRRCVRPALPNSVYQRRAGLLRPRTAHQQRLGARVHIEVVAQSSRGFSEPSRWQLEKVFFAEEPRSGGRGAALVLGSIR